jgi:hypothetical protein
MHGPINIRMIVLLRITYSDVQIYCNIAKRETFQLKSQHTKLFKSFEQVSRLRDINIVRV